MSKFTHIVDMLRSSNDQLARMQLFGIMKKVQAGTYKINDDLVTVPELAALLDWLRQRVGYPIAPFDAEAPEKTWLLHALTPGVVAFGWRWWDLPMPWLDDSDMQHNLFPLPNCSRG